MTTERAEEIAGVDLPCERASLQIVVLESEICDCNMFHMIRSWEVGWVLR
jgi:hypothetical protein